MDGGGSSSSGGSNNSSNSLSSESNNGNNNSNAPNHGGGSGSGAANAAALEGRWTCEACGCNTNQSTDRNCTICGTSHAGPSLMRRPGAGASFAARAGWFARGLGVRRGIISDELSLDDDGLWETVVGSAGRNGSAGSEDDGENALESSLAMEAIAASELGAGGGASSSNRTRLLERHQRFIDAARAFSQATSRGTGESHTNTYNVDPSRLLQYATENASNYQPVWSKPSTHVSTSRSRSVSSGVNSTTNHANGIEVGEGDFCRLAHLPSGLNQGCAVRAEPPLPRNDILSPFRIPSPSHSSSSRTPQRKAYGFRVAFDHPRCEQGGSMGGYHLIGITSSSFNAYSEQNGLQHSPYFWGIEDSGQKYEGSRYNQGRSRRTTVSPASPAGSGSSATYSTGISPSEVPMNTAGVLFGSREVVTVVVDLESRSLTFWRDETLLGTLVHNIPRSGSLYPVAVPYNCGVAVVITPLDSDPLPILQTFSSDWKRLQQERDEEIRHRLDQERSILIQYQKPTDGLIRALQEVFKLYVVEIEPSKYDEMKENDDDADTDEGDALCLNRVMATRLWYRCGMSLSDLNKLLDTKPKVTFQDFLDRIVKVIEDEELLSSVSGASGATNSIYDAAPSFEVGDRVEVVDGYEKFGDAARGPLRPGDRGIVVELQKGPNGDNRSIRVLHSSRRWWYQPQALLSERSLQFESSSVWFIRSILRAHSYDHITLTSLAGQPVTTASWRYGDMVSPCQTLFSTPHLYPSGNLIARILPETTGITCSLASRARDSGTVFLEYVGHDFAEAVGFKSSFDHASPITIESRRVQCAKLVFSNIFQTVSARPVKKEPKETEKDRHCERDSVYVSLKVRSDVAGLGRFERSSIEAVSRESKKRADSLACLFAAGLTDAILSAVGVAERQMNSLEPREDVAEKLLALGGLINSIAEQLFAPPLSSVNESMNTDDRLSTADTLDRNIASNEDTTVHSDTEDRMDNINNLPSSLQQRRNMLLSLMSRATRRGNASAYLNEIADGREDSNLSEFPVGLFPALPASMRDVPPFVFGAPSEFLEAWTAARGESSGHMSSTNNDGINDSATNDSEITSEDIEATIKTLEQMQTQYSYLDSILRCRGSGSTTQGYYNSLKEGGAALAVLARTLVANGILINSIDWTKAIVDDHIKKMQLASVDRSSFSLKEITDEEGTPLLQLAISLGSAVEILHLLIGYGCQVGRDEVMMACVTGQSEVLKLLLQYASFDEYSLDLRNCSQHICQIVQETKARKAELYRQMRDSAGYFVTQLLRKFFKLCLTARRNQSVRFDQCSKSICEVLVGNILLRALHDAQKTSKSSSRLEGHKTRSFESRDRADKSGRFSVDENIAELNIGPHGLLELLPRDLLGECILSEKEHFIQYLTVIEDYLYSKDLTDTASGLTFLLVFLKTFPELRSCSEMERFGFHELATYHNVLTSSKIAELLSKQVSLKLNVSSLCKEAKEDCDVVSGLEYPANSVVMCPKKHTAVLHITRHSSFRCDLCGNGVERGRPMHGCRECDWDACEECTDKAECGLVKCTAVKNIASQCLKLFDEKAVVESSKTDFEFSNIITELFEEDTSSVLGALAIRFLQRDVHAAKDLGVLLHEPGKVSIHQFLAIVLPSLHVSLVGCPRSRSIIDTAAGHQNKKPRVVGKGQNSCGDSQDFRLEYCREALRLMVMESRVVSRPTLFAGIHSSVNQQNENTNDISDSEGAEDLVSMSRELCYALGSSEVLRRLHQVLSLNENVNLVSSAEKRDPAASKGGDLQSLTKLIEIRLSPSSFGETGGMHVAPIESVIYAEPLLPIGELRAQVLRAYKHTDPLYVAYCESLPADNAIIMERPLSSSKRRQWRVAKVLNFDVTSGTHILCYAKYWRTEVDCFTFNLSQEPLGTLTSSLYFSDTQCEVVLAAREYYILERTRSSQTFATSNSEAMIIDDASRDSSQLVGTRVESNCGTCSAWEVYTVVRVSEAANSDLMFSLISDEGELYSNIPPSQLRSIGNDHTEEPYRRRRLTRDDRGGVFPFFAGRSRSDSGRVESNDGNSSVREKALKRSWSAIALNESMKPIDLRILSENYESKQKGNSREMTWEYQLGDRKFYMVGDIANVEFPPTLIVGFSTKDKLPGAIVENEKTLVRALVDIQKQQDNYHEWPPKASVSLFFSIRMEADRAMPSEPFVSDRATTSAPTEFLTIPCGTADSKPVGSSKWDQRPESRSRKLSSRSLGVDDEDRPATLCDGIDELCIQCMEVISLLAECAENNSVSRDKDDSSVAGFSNTSLSKKLLEQLDDPLCVVSGALPEWCVVAPSFAPRVFSYDSRRALLERAAFGVSRSTLKQQEAKVNVGRLRQRMSSLRARAVELVGEAFSGGAEDPTALQLQADELYGMEEALATRVRAAFRAAKWQEHSLQVAKAAVRREFLLSDAVALMELYSNDPIICRRRLEVRFEGESGFDAASGDEAGVTRGFYADVAEALLSVENVAGVYCASSCSLAASTVFHSKNLPTEIDEADLESMKLPLWIPDLDNSSQVVIPTPRGDKRSSLGVFPRPIPIYHPQFTDVLLNFRFIGRLFAAAMRDGFMFPLPISSAFLKLVQYGKQLPDDIHKSNNNVPEPIPGMVLSSNDLPRPGFLGGEIYAADFHICRALDELDSLDPPLPHAELQRRYEEIENNKNFGKTALGKSYDLSFKEYFEDRTFVDPLDPTQGEDAVPLCNKGHTKQVTIYNIREWVTLAKIFVLHEGVISQALAFRQGVDDLFPAVYLRLFTAVELQRDICGTGGDVDNWDESAVRKLFKLDGGKGAAEALVAVAAIGGEGGAALSRRFCPSSPTITFLVKALLEATPVQRRQFLSFVTSVPIVTPGRIEVVPIISPGGEFLAMKDPSCLPRANTCSRRLYLPKFESFDTFSEVLWAVVREESKFKGFFEWRGS